MMESFFPPELVMQNQGALGLSAEQKSTIKETMQNTMAKFTDLQWQQSEATETMAALFDPEKVDEEKALAQLDKLLDIENQVKRLHVATVIKIRNVLTPEQQAKLRDLRRGPMAPPMGQPEGQRVRPMGPGRGPQGLPPEGPGPFGGPDAPPPGR
jgi:Spy/CpxP family protein refolding chaperone